MTIAAHAVGNPAGERLIYLLELSLPGWVAPLRYAEDSQDWTVTVETAATATFLSMGFDAESADADDSGVDARGITVPDEDLVLWRRIEANIGGSEAITATIRMYLSSNLAAPVAVSTLQLAEPEQGVDRSVHFTATTADTINRGAPTLRYTVGNSPGLRR